MTFAAGQPHGPMTADVVLIAGLAAFWGGIWLLIKVDHLWHGRPLSNGPSLVPVVPVVPLLGLLAGWLLNRVAPWLGTGLMGVLHAVGVCHFVVRDGKEWRT